MRLLYLALFAAALAACGDADVDPDESILDTSLRAIAADSMLEIRDVSVPFERFAEAPAKLQAVHQALQSGPTGVYVMRYFDDTLRHTLHVFVVGDTEQIYIKLSTAPGKRIAEEDFDIRGARFDEATNTLVLDTHAGEVRLTPQHVTPAGA